VDTPKISSHVTARGTMTPIPPP